MPGTPKADSPKPKTRRPRRWRRRLAITGLVLLVLIPLIAGPGSRWVIQTIVTKQFATQGLTGSFKIKGRIFSGYTFENVSFHGSGPIRSLEAEELMVQYRFLRLIDKQMDLLSGREIHVVLHPEPKQEKTKEEKEEEDARRPIEIPEETIRTIRQFVAPIALDFRNVSVEVQRNELPPLTVQLAGLSHDSDAGLYRVSGLTSNALGDRGLPVQDFELGWTDADMALTRFIVLPNLTISSLRLEMPPAGPDKIIAAVSLAGASVEIEADETGSAKLILKDDSLDLQRVVEELPVDLDLSGTLHAFTLDVDDLFAPPSDWRGILELDATMLRYGRVVIKALRAQGDISSKGMELVTILGPNKDTELKISSPLPSGEGKMLLANYSLDFNLEIRALDSFLERALAGPGGDEPKAPSVLPGGTCSISGRLVHGEDGKIAQAAAHWHAESLTYDEKPIPPLQGSLKLAGELAEAEVRLAKPAEGETIELSAKARIDLGTYEGSAGIHLPNPAWLNAFLPGDSPLWKPSGPIDLDWEGSGSYKEMTHKGSADLGELRLADPHDNATSISSRISYDLPEMLSLDSLLVRNGDLKVSGDLSWKDGTLTIPGILTADETGPLMKFSGHAPLASSLRSLDDLLDQDDAIDLSFEADQFALQRLRKLLPVNLPEGYQAKLESRLHLTGTAARPKLDGDLQILEVRVPEPAGIPPLDARLTFSTRGDTLGVQGSFSEPDGEVLTLNADLPLKIREWADDPESIQAATFKAHAVSESFNFSRIERFVPRLAGVKGQVGIDLTADGTVADPALAGNIAVELDHLPLPETPFRLVENSKILARFEGRRITLDPSPIHIAGGKLILTGDANLEGEEPEFNLNLNADHALLWRNDSLSTRANAQLTLAGTPSNAKISGTVDIVDSLFYKDIEIIPIGVPTTSAPKPQLPKIDRPSDGPPVAAPAPFKDWLLDVKIRTADPILIRGNLASGSILANATVGGTISTPRPNGEILLRDLEAKLPFSTLKVKKGTLTLRPDSPLNPTLDIAGTSHINNRKIRMLVFGPLAQPKYTLTSNPPLPENEILSLIATGATTSDLEDTNTASMKAFQLMIEELRRRSTRPGSNELFKRLMQDLGKVELNVAENDPFSGKKFSSATLQLSNKYYLSAGFDDEGNTRARIIYSLRFR